MKEFYLLTVSAVIFAIYVIETGRCEGEEWENTDKQQSENDQANGPPTPLPYDQSTETSVSDNGQESNEGVSASPDSHNETQNTNERPDQPEYIGPETTPSDVDQGGQNTSQEQFQVSTEGGNLGLTPSGNDDNWKNDDLGSTTPSNSEVPIANDEDGSTTPRESPGYSSVTVPLDDQSIANTDRPEDQTESWNSDVTTYPIENQDGSNNNDREQTTVSDVEHNTDSGSNDGDSTSNPEGNGETEAIDVDQVTSGSDYGDFPVEEPDKFGEELVARCKSESNYQGDFQDPNESSTELKCFYACALKGMDVMNEDNGNMQINIGATDDLLTDAFGDNYEMIERYKNAVTTCENEVEKSDDRCEYAFNFINCGIQRLSIA